VNHIGDQVETCTGQQFEVLVFGFSVGNLSLHDQLLMMNFLGCAASCKKKKNKLHGLVSGPGYVWVPLPVTEPMAGSALKNGRECEQSEGKCQCTNFFQLGQTCKPGES